MSIPKKFNRWGKIIQPFNFWKFALLAMTVIGIGYIIWVKIYKKETKQLPKKALPEEKEEIQKKIPTIPVENQKPADITDKNNE